MIIHRIDPVAFSIGKLNIYWYGISYIVGISLAWHMLNRRIKQPQFDWTKQQVSDIVFYAMLGIIIGGRLGSVLFYNLPYYLDHPVDILKIYQGGMSFHGGLIGVLAAMYWYGRSIGKSFLEMTDFIAPVVPIGLGFGRLGNFVNGELWGMPTDLPWGVVFNSVYAGGIARHPTQLYEAFLEGLVLFLLLWWFSAKPRLCGLVSACFLIGYGVFRSGVELIREPDQHIGYLAFDWVTMGHILCLPMIIVGLVIIYIAVTKMKTDKTV